MRSIAIIILLVLSACSSGDQPSSAEGDTGSYGNLLSDLCAAIESTEEDNAGEARRVFEDEIHGPLHELAAEVEAVDREATANLLVAKNNVEKAFDSSARSGSLRTELTALADSLSVALRAVGVNNSGCS